MSEQNTERPKPQEYHRIMRIVSEWGCHCSHDGPCDMNCDFGVIESCTKTLAARIAELELKYDPAFALNTEMADRNAKLEAENAELREVKEVCDYIKTNHPGHYKAALMSIRRSNKAALAARDQQKGGE